MKESKRQEQWNKKHLQAARLYSEMSQDNSTKVGAVIAEDNNKIVTVGINGTPTNMKDEMMSWERPVKYSIVIHAEHNAVKNALRRADVNLSTCRLYCTHSPCPTCLSLIVDSGIRWVMFEELGPTVTRLDMPKIEATIRIIRGTRGLICRDIEGNRYSDLIMKKLDNQWDALKAQQEKLIKEMKNNPEDAELVIYNQKLYDLNEKEINHILNIKELIYKTF